VATRIIILVKLKITKNMVMVHTIVDKVIYIRVHTMKTKRMEHSYFTKSNLYIIRLYLLNIYNI
jgi:hypothetical protein